MPTSTLPACMSEYHMCIDAGEGKKRVSSEPLELELQTVVSCCVAYKESNPVPLEKQ